MAAGPSAVRLKFEQTCPDCSGSDFVEDHSQGDLICSNCGLVLEQRGIDERSEWRTFADKEGGADPNRVGGPTNHLLSDNLSTEIGASDKGMNALTQNLKRTLAQGSNPDRSLTTGFKRIAKLCDNLGLVRGIYDRACELFKKVTEGQMVKGRSASSIIPAVVFLACRHEQMPRTFKEILLVAEDTTKKDVARTFKIITQKMGDGSELPPTAHVSDYMRRFCSELRLQHKDVKACEEVALAACPRDGIRPDSGTRAWDGKSPLSIAAAVLLVVTRMPKASGKPSLDEIATTAGVAEVTVRSTAAQLMPYLTDLIPAWFATKEQVYKAVSDMGYQ